MMHILFRDMPGSCRPFAIETENASMARPTPSSALLRKNKKLHSITECLLNLTKITVRQKQNPRSARVYVRSRVIFYK